MFAGLVGGVCLTGAGLGYGVIQLGRGAVKADNFTDVYTGLQQAAHDIGSATQLPVGR